MPRHTQRGDPEQLKMFMTPREIVNKYQVLDADRQGYGENEWDASAARNWQRTGRSQRTEGQGNIWDAGRIHYAEGGTGDYIREPREETDTEVLSRKSQEAQLDPEYYKEMRGESPAHFDAGEALERSSAPKAPSGGRTSAWDEHDMQVDSYLNRKENEHFAAQDDRSIWDSVRQEGVQHPVHLGTQFGSQGKPQIVGGHHRIAAALDTRPNDLIPVVHHEDIWEAKQGKGYKYR